MNSVHPLIGVLYGPPEISLPDSPGQCVVVAVQRCGPGIKIPTIVGKSLITGNTFYVPANAKVFAWVDNDDQPNTIWLTYDEWMCHYNYSELINDKAN